jgi:hypothetical protein
MTAKTPDGNTLDSLVLVKKDGKYQPEIMKRAWDTQEAIAVTFIISGFSADVAEMPQAGKPVTLTLSSRAFPKGTQVKLALQRTMVLPDRRAISAISPGKAASERLSYG